MSRLSALWAALRSAPALVEGLRQAGDLLVAGGSPLAAVDTFAARSGLGTEAAGELRVVATQAVTLLALLAHTSSRLVQEAPALRAGLETALASLVDVGLWAATQEYRLKGWLDEAARPPPEAAA